MTLRPRSSAPLELSERLSSLSELGFELAGACDVVEVKGLVVCGLAHEAERIYGAVYQHPQLGMWTELIVRYADAGSVMATSALHGPEVDGAPGHERLHLPLADEATLLKALRADRPASVPAKEVSVASFVAVFEQAYADEMEWRMARGGAALEQMRRIADAPPGRFSDEVVRQARVEMEREESRKLSAQCQEAYRATMDERSWSRIEGEIVVVHERMSAAGVWDALEGALDSPQVHEGERKVIEWEAAEIVSGGGEVFSLASELLALFPPTARFEQLESLERPVRALVLRRPR